LLDGPLCRGMGGDVDMDDAAALMRQHHKYV
jgi:hypothetical protein